MKKIISLLMIVILVSVSFTIYFPEEVDAASVNTCALTNDGDFCVEGEDIARSDCKTGYFYQGKRGDQVEDCKLGTCIPMEGECLSQKTRIECVNGNLGRWDILPKLSVPECQVGCCNVAGSLCNIEEQKYCVHDLAGDDVSAFDVSITDEAQCNAVCNAAVEGCYKQGGACTYGSQETFFDLADFNPGDFHSNTYCSQVQGCFATSGAYSACGNTEQTKLDIYYYDSAGNREGLSEGCGYPDKFCYDSDGERGDSPICRSTSCVSGLEGEAEPGEFRTGESLCVNVHPYHYTQQGRSKEIKPYILSCQFGEIKADDTIDRNVVCVEQRDADGRLHATTIENKWNDCNTCGSGGGILGNLGDVFGFLVPPLSSLGLLTTRPCKGEYDLPVILGDRCDSRGKIDGVKMCGYGPLDKDGNYDSDLWAPIGSCNPLYPPTEPTSCNLCGRGGDSILNTCTVDECNALGDCKFVEQNVNWDVAVTAGGVWVGTCTSLYLLSFVPPLSIFPGTTAMQSTAASMCYVFPSSTPTGAAVISAFLLKILVPLGLDIGATAGTQETQVNQAQFELTDEGKVRLSDILILGKSFESSFNYEGLGWIVWATSASMYYNFGHLIWKGNGRLTRTALFDGVEQTALKDAKEKALKVVQEKYLKEGGIGEIKAFIDKDGGIRFVTPKNVEQLDTKTLSEIRIEGSKVYEEVGESVYVTMDKVISGALILFSVYSLGKSFNPGDCVPETAYTNNEKCELCGLGEGQWYCTEERCDILGQETGHCKFVGNNDGTPNGKCIPLDVSDANPPIITNVKSKIYDNNNNLIKEDTSSDKKLDVDLRSVSNAWRSTNITIEFETDENSECTFIKQPQHIFESPDDFGGQDNGFSKQHIMGVGFTDTDKTAGTLFIYLKCMDVNENKIEDDNNYVKILFPPRPDTEPPVIKYIDPISVMLPEDTGEVNLQLIAFDENKVSGCKYSETKEDYEEMENLFDPGGVIDCSDLVQGNNKCNLFTTTVDLSEGGTQISYDDIREEHPDVPEDILANLENMRTYFYNVLCKDTQGQIMDEPYFWSLSVVPGFEIDVKDPVGEIYNKVVFNITTGGNPTICSYAIDNQETQYNFTELLSTVHVKEHEDYLMQGSHTVKFNCRDYPGNEAEKEITFNVLVEDLVITSFKPDDELFYTNEVILEIKTQGGLYGNGNSTCKYGTSVGNYNVEIEEKFTIGDETTHTKQLIDLSDGVYNYYVSCVDKAEKKDTTLIKFRVDIDSVPQLTRVYTEDTLLSLEVREPSECKYSDEDFEFEEGTNKMVSSNSYKHQASLQDVFYIKCKNLNNGNVNTIPFIIYP